MLANEKIQKKYIIIHRKSTFLLIRIKFTNSGYQKKHKTSFEMNERYGWIESQANYYALPLYLSTSRRNSTNPFILRHKT